MITILKQMIFNMSRKKYLTESIEDFGKQIVNNVYDTLIQWNYDQGEIDSIVGRDSIELDIENGECVLHCGNEIIYSTPSNVLIHKFAPAAEDALLNWCIKKIGREPERIDANDLFSDVPGWNSLNEAYGTDFEDTLAWVQKKFPNKSEKEQHQFAKNIMKRYAAPAETNSTDVVEKPKAKKNVKLIKIVDIPNHGRHQDVYCKSLLLRTARKPGDTERVNHTVLGRLNAAGVKYEIIDENVNKNMGKKNTIRLTESELKKVISESVKQIISELDWKTKQWAADERMKRDDDVFNNGQNSPYYNKYQKRDFTGQQHSNQLEAAREFNKRYGLNDYESSYKSPDGTSTSREVGMNSLGDLDATYATTKQTGKRNGEYGWHTLDTGNQYRFDTDDARTRNAYNRAKDEFNKYKNGNYQYTKGKGWHLKDDK